MEIITASKESKTTQRRITTSTYKKVAQYAKDHLQNTLDVLDYGAGLCAGTEALKEILPKSTVISYEPNPNDNGNRPDFTLETLHLVADNSFDVVVNNCVLNVLEGAELRRAVIVDMISKLRKGGTAFIMVRSRSDIGSIKTGKSVGDCEFKLPTGAFQKGYDHTQLTSEISESLIGTGMDVHIERFKKVSSVGVTVEKL